MSIHELDLINVGSARLCLGGTEDGDEGEGGDLHGGGEVVGSSFVLLRTFVMALTIRYHAMVAMGLLSTDEVGRKRTEEPGVGE